MNAFLAACNEAWSRYKVLRRQRLIKELESEAHFAYKDGEDVSDLIEQIEALRSIK